MMDPSEPRDPMPVDRDDIARRALRFVANITPWLEQLDLNEGYNASNEENLLHFQIDGGSLVQDMHELLIQGWGKV